MEWNATYGLFQMERHAIFMGSDPFKQVLTESAQLYVQSAHPSPSSNSRQLSIARFSSAHCSDWLTMD